MNQASPIRYRKPGWFTQHIFNKAVSLAQALWAFAHGTLILELDRRFLDGSNLDRTWQAGTEAFTAARLATLSPSTA